MLILLVQLQFQNKMKKKYLFAKVVLLILLFSGCDRIVCKYKNLPDLGNGYRFETLNCKTLLIVNHNNDVMVMGLILNYTFDSTFIIVSQRPWDSIPNIRTMKYSEATEAFEKSTFRQYWIINKKEKDVYSYDSISRLATYSNVYGPFKKEEYLKKRKELGVPDKLKLKSK